jgi:DEAD/DEAH box helicase
MARGAVSLAQVSVLVLDEADRMLDMGFRPAVDRIVRACRSRRQTGEVPRQPTTRSRPRRARPRRNRGRTGVSRAGSSPRST